MVLIGILYVLLLNSRLFDDDGHCTKTFLLIRVQIAAAFSKRHIREILLIQESRIHNLPLSNFKVLDLFSHRSYFLVVFVQQLLFCIHLDVAIVNLPLNHVIRLLTRSKFY